jgi:uncharacterized membrane protein YedE/YeeE
MTMAEFSVVTGLAGGALIGLGAALLLIMNGKIAGISGIVGGLLVRGSPDRFWRSAFVIGLIAGGFLAPIFMGYTPDIAIPAPSWLIVIAGLLVGFGTRLGNGCTSGHGVCGLARLSPRSLVATLTFIGTAMITVYIVRHVLGG